MRLFIIGFKNSGKTTFGRKLADRLHMEFIDLDDYIEKRTGRSVPDIFTTDGEDAFRISEWKALKEIVRKDGIIVSTGGGAACHCDNMNLMEKFGETIYIKVDDDTLVSRLREFSADRPLVRGKSVTELRDYVAKLKDRCEHHYKRAKYILENENIDVEKLISMMEKS
jgi:shikimate kinase